LSNYQAKLEKFDFVDEAPSKTAKINFKKLIGL